MIMIENNNRHYLTQSIVWIDYRENIADDSKPEGDELMPGHADDSILSVGFSEGATTEKARAEAANIARQLEAHFNVTLG